MYEPKCLFCNSNENTKLLYEATIKLEEIKSEYLITRARKNFHHYRILNCKKCNLSFSNPVLDENELSALYKNTVIDSFKEDNLNAAETYFNYFKKFVKNKELNILEIGCSEGYFLKKLKDDGFINYYGIEPAKIKEDKIDEDIRKRIINDTFSSKVFNNKKFDIICAFMILEHLLKPDKFLIECKNLLTDNGALILVIHNINSYLTKILGEKNPIINLGHIYYFNEATIKRLLELCGFKSIKIIPLKNSYSLNYWLEMFPYNNTFLMILKKLLKTIKISDLKISINVGNLFIYAK